MTEDENISLTERDHARISYLFHGMRDAHGFSPGAYRYLLHSLLGAYENYSKQILDEGMTHPIESR